MPPKSEFLKKYGRDIFAVGYLDVTDGSDIQKVFDEASLAFGGVDIVVNSAGLSISKPLEEHTEKDWCAVV